MNGGRWSGCLLPSSLTKQTVVPCSQNSQLKPELRLEGMQFKQKFYLKPIFKNRQTAFLFEVLNFRHLTSSIRSLKIPLKECCGDSPTGPVAKNLSCNAGHMGFIPGWGTKIPQASLHNQKERNAVNLNIFKLGRRWGWGARFLLKSSKMISPKKKLPNFSLKS